MNIEDFEITEKQEKAFNEVVKAMKKAKRMGLSFYGKSNSLTAYKTKAIDNAVPLHMVVSDGDYNNPVPCISSSVLSDCGADDTEYFPKGFITESE